MSNAYLAYAERAQLVCAYDKNPAKALKKAAKLIDDMCETNENVMLTGVNVQFDDDGYYNITATVSSVISPL